MKRVAILILGLFLFASAAFAQLTMTGNGGGFGTSGGGGPTIIYTQSITGNDNGNGGYSFRTKHVVTGATVTQIRATFSADTSIGSLTANNCSVGKWAGTNADTTITPQELLFSGGHGFTITTTPGGTVTSDWLTISGWSLANGDTAVLICDFGTNGNVGVGAFVTGNDIYYHSAAASYNVAAPAAYTQFNETALVAKIETQ